MSYKKKILLDMWKFGRYNCTLELYCQLYFSLYHIVVLHSCIQLFPILILFPNFLRDFLLKSRIRFLFPKTDDLSHLCINIDARVSLYVERKINIYIYIYIYIYNLKNRVSRE